MSDDFKLVRTLGEGAFGKVYLVNSSRGSKFAMKVIDLRTSPQEEKELAVSEANLLKNLQHPHVLAYTDSFERDGALCIVTEFCGSGDLAQYLEKRDGKKLEEDKLTNWFRQIASALEYLHGRKIIHRDIKTPNVFLTDTLDTKLGDMGLAKVLERPNAKAVTFCGSPYYMSPEIFSCKPYDAKSDIWALGVIVYEMSTLERPFDAMLMHQLVFKIVHGGLPPMPSTYRPSFVELLSSIMQKDPEKRPSAAEILQHKFFKEAPPTPTTPPAVGADDAAAAAGGGNRRWVDIRKPPLKGKEVGAGGPFNMDDLLDTLSMVRRKDSDPQAAGGSTPDKSGKGIHNILAKSHITPKKKKFEKTTKTIKINNKPKPGISDDTVVSVSQVTMYIKDTTRDFDTTLKAIQSETASSAFNVMQMIVRTMTGILPDNQKEKEEAMKRTQDPQGMILRQIEHLQYYCTKVLGPELFQASYDLLGSVKDEHVLEERLQEILGKENFESVGVQLMFLKNFEYNLMKITDPKSPRK